MSSITSSTPLDPPGLTLELKPSWPVLGVLSGWLLLVAAAIPAAVPVSWPWRVMMGCAVLTIGVLSLRSQLFGLCGQTLQRATLHPDGQWLLADGEGRQWTAALSAGSRSLAGVVFLSWSTPERRDWAVVAGSRANRATLRRLRVRLRRS